LLASCGFVDIERHEVPFVAEFADPETYARAISAVGPAHEAIENVGEEEFFRSAVTVASERVREGLPLRARIAAVGYLARKPRPVRASSQGQTAVTSFLGAAAPSAAADKLFDDDVQGLGYVMNTSKLWAHDPGALERLSELLGHVVDTGSLTFRQRGILVTACASALGDSYCSLAWGKKLAGVTNTELAVAVLRGEDEVLDETDRALARWARKVARDPNGTTTNDIQSLRDAGFDDAQIFAISAFVALRVNDALGAQPDQQLGVEVPDAVRDAVTFGRPISPT
jgi:alkylhydroperoxidase family enzyme